MSISISIAKPLADIQGLSNIVLSAFAPGAQPKRSSQLSDSLDTSSADNCQKSLLSVIEAQIIPQLMQAHTSVADSQTAPKTSRTFTDEEIEQFSESCLGNELDQPLAYVMGLIEQGVSIESVFIDLITPAARWLGQQWELDQG